MTTNFRFTAALILPASFLLAALLSSCTSLNNHDQAHTTELSPEVSVSDEAPPSMELVLQESLNLQHSQGLGNAGIEVSTSLPEPSKTIAIEAEELEKIAGWQAAPSAQKPTNEPKEVEYNFPITINRQVEYYLDFFQNRSHKSFSRWLSRSSRYLPMITEQLTEAGMPTDLAYLPMIESGYALNAYSRAKAVGPWQFMRGTAVNFGLQVDNYVDERRDPVKSTKAAIAYLRILHDEFDSWELAVAGYNAGEGRIRKAIKRYKTNDFWKIAEYKYLPSETKLYVPKLIAAIIIAKSPEEYGFTNIKYADSMVYEMAQVPRWTTIQAVTTALNADPKELQLLNCELKKQITPPDQAFYNLKIPPGNIETLAQNLPRVQSTVSTEVKFHKIRKHDTLNRICRKYKISKTTLLKANNLHKAKLTPGRILRIPHRVTKYVLLSEEEMKNSNHAKHNGEFILHRIKPGETVGAVARRYNVTPQLIASWNGLADINKIRAGQPLALYVNRESTAVLPPTISTTKAAGHKSTSQIVSLSGSSKKAPKSKEKSGVTTYYQVKGGDSLWKIARRFKLHTDDIRRWNNLKNDLIKPGLKLRLKLEADA